MLHVVQAGIHSLPSPRQIGYARAAQLSDELEAVGVVGPAHGTDPREVLIKSYEEFVEKRKELSKEKKKGVSKTSPTYSVTKSLIGTSSGWFDIEDIY